MSKLLILLAFMSLPASVLASESCEQIQQTIVKTITSHGVKNPSALVISKDEKPAEKAKVVGHCDHGKKLIVYAK